MHPDDTAACKQEGFGRDNVILDGNHAETLRTVLRAINALPGVKDRVDAFLMGCNVEDPQEEINALTDQLY